ncbi:MAG TPA: glycosyltransferase [Pyrinomonadaceae bacterium]|nr:glycosyltransferase [Pyrinomonadaceae bacterium]
MRIFTAVRHSNDSRFYYGNLWSRNFYPALRELGHEIVECKVDLLQASDFMHTGCRFTPQEMGVRGRITEQIIDEVKTAHRQRPINLFLSYFYNAHFDPLGVDEIHRLDIPTVNFYCNSIYQFELVSAIASRVRFSWHPEKNARAQYLKAGANPVWVQMAADPKVCHPIPNVARRRRTCFVGQRYCDRDRWLASLARQGVPVDIYGNGWLPDTNSQHEEEKSQGVRWVGSAEANLEVFRKNVKQNGLVGGSFRTLRQAFYATETRRLRSVLKPHAKGRAENLSEVLSSYEVVLNFSNVWADGRLGSRLIPHVRLRDFEAPMCRTCYLTGDTDEINEFYEVGREIDTYRTPEELIDKANYYLRHAELAEKLRNQGYRRALRDHTWLHRFKELFQKIGLSSGG